MAPQSSWCCGAQRTQIARSNKESCSWAAAHSLQDSHTLRPIKSTLVHTMLAAQTYTTIHTHTQQQEYRCGRHSRGLFYLSQETMMSDSSQKPREQARIACMLSLHAILVWMPGHVAINSAPAAATPAVCTVGRSLCVVWPHINFCGLCQLLC